MSTVLICLSKIPSNLSISSEICFISGVSIFSGHKIGAKMYFSRNQGI
jgi:hypothetical protein